MLCSLSKSEQTKNKFPVSDFRALDAFELIHYDLWASIEMSFHVEHPIF